MLQGLRSESEMREALSEEVYTHLVSAQQERQQAKAEMRGLLGRVVERPQPPKDVGAGSQTPSLAGGCCARLHVEVLRLLRDCTLVFCSTQYRLMAH